LIATVRASSAGRIKHQSRRLFGRNCFLNSWGWLGKSLLIGFAALKGLFFGFCGQRLLSASRSTLRVLGLSFYPVDLLDRTTVIYAVEQLLDSNKRSNLEHGFISENQPGAQSRSVAAKFIF
jgi:esterase/lipase superfamily enzyme